MLKRIAKLLRIQYPDTTDVGYLLSSGKTVPTNATAGYQTGCLFSHTDGSAEASVYVNEGSVTSCLFAPLLTTSNELQDLPDFGAMAYTSGKILVADGDSYEEVAVGGQAAMDSTGAVTIALLGATAGTATASKAVILDSNVKVDRSWIAATSAQHALYVTAAASLTTKNAFRAGDWGTELAYSAGGGLFRMYGNISAGTDATTMMFVRSLVTSQASSSAIQIYADSDCSTPGPAGLHAADFYAVVNDTKFLGASAQLYDGLVSTWHKITAPVGATITGNAWTIFLDNQINCAVGGTEATILSMTGGSKPDAWAYFSTTSSGWASLFTFDAAAAAQDPVVTNALVPAAAPDAGTMGADKALKVVIDGTPYYIPLYDTLHA